MTDAKNVRQRVFIDTNVLVYAMVSSMPLNASATAALRRMWEEGRHLCINGQVLREYLAVMTRTNTTGCTKETLALDIKRFSETFIVLDDTASVRTCFLELFGSYDVKGSDVHDMNIVATMQAHAIDTILTHNVKDFARYEPRITVLPLT